MVYLIINMMFLIDNMVLVKLAKDNNLDCLEFLIKSTTFIAVLLLIQVICVLSEMFK